MCRFFIHLYIFIYLKAAYVVSEMFKNSNKVMYYECSSWLSYHSAPAFDLTSRFCDSWFRVIWCCF